MFFTLYLAVGLINILARNNNYNIYISKTHNMDIRVRRHINENDFQDNEINQKLMKQKEFESGIYEIGINDNINYIAENKFEYGTTNGVVIKQIQNKFVNGINEADRTETRKYMKDSELRRFNEDYTKENILRMDNKLTMNNIQKYIINIIKKYDVNLNVNKPVRNINKTYQTPSGLSDNNIDNEASNENNESKLYEFNINDIGNDDKLYEVDINEVNNNDKLYKVDRNEVNNDDKLYEVDINEVGNDDKLYEVDINEVNNKYISRRRRHTKNDNYKPQIVVLGSCFMCVNLGCPKFFRKIGINCVPESDDDY
ncbi:uncharacterized protein ACR2FA_007285 [Aphomia sociella]